ncbi:hypothetical protein ABIB39_003743 [Mucilaginibacter sp. UYP27]
MEFLNSENRLWYLKAININDKSNTLWLSFRQEALYRITSDYDDNRYYYKNAMLLLWFDDYLTAEKQFKILKEFYLDEVISIDEDTPNLIEFCGGHDVQVKVVKYEESIIDQSKEDWIERYQFVSKENILNHAQNELELNFIKDIEILLKNYEKGSLDHNDDRLYQTLSQKLKELRSPRRNVPTSDLLLSMNRQLYAINEKLDLLK